MSDAVVELFEQGGGEFISPPSLFIDRLKKVKAILFDWDGVFNNGFKQGTFGSVFSEVDSMGTNMLRYALWRASSILPATAILPVTAIITGETNPSALQLAQRESFHAVYSHIKNKGETFARFLAAHKLQPSEVLFFFDDILDLSVAEQCGARILIGRKSTPMLTRLVKGSGMADYVTAHDGGNHGLREGMELVVGLLGQFEEVARNRMTYSENYQSYLAARRQISTLHIDGAK